MRRACVLILMGLGAILLQSVLALHLPRGLVPDLGFLVVVAVGLELRAGAGLVVASLLGYATDLLSGALLGQYALLRATACALTGWANRRLDLHGTLPLAFFAGGLTLFDAVGVMAITGLYGGRIALDADLLLLLGTQVVVNTVTAPLVGATIHRILEWTAHDEGLRRKVRLAPRAPIV